jgi:hypothetical protein
LNLIGRIRLTSSEANFLGIEQNEAYGSAEASMPSQFRQGRRGHHNACDPAGIVVCSGRTIQRGVVVRTIHGGGVQMRRDEHDRTPSLAF